MGALSAEVASENAQARNQALSDAQWQQLRAACFRAIKWKLLTMIKFGREKYRYLCDSLFGSRPDEMGRAEALTRAEKKPYKLWMGIKT